jgi:yecA family protein
MTEQTIDYDLLDDALQRCGSSWSAGQTHGLLCGRLSVAGADGATRWFEQVLEDTDPNNALRGECESLLDALCASTWRQLVERQSEFELLLPHDGDTTAARTAAMAHWCEGFLHGLVSEKHSDALKERLAAEPLADIVRDLLQITRAATDEDADEEGEENAYAELVEYLRVAAQLAYEELAEFREPVEDALPDDAETLH